MTGFVLLLPIVLTIWITMFIVNLLTKPFLGILQSIFTYYHLLDNHPFVINNSHLVMIGIKISILIALLFFVILVGFIARLVLFRYLFRFGDYILHRIPLINKIYRAFQDVMRTLFSSGETAFSQVVLVPFPHSETLSIGFITKGTMPENTAEEYQGNISIFVPGTPNPTMGFMLMFKKEEVLFLDMTVEEAFKFIVSCGVMFKGFNPAAINKSPQDISAK